MADETWKDLKVNFDEPSLMEKSYRMNIATVFRDFVIPFHMWQHQRDLVEAAIEDRFEESTGVLPKSVQAGARCGKKQSDIVIHVSGFRISFIPIKFVSESDNE